MKKISFSVDSWKVEKPKFCFTKNVGRGDCTHYKIFKKTNRLYSQSELSTKSGELITTFDQLRLFWEGNGAHLKCPPSSLLHTQNSCHYLFTIVQFYCMQIINSVSLFINYECNRKCLLLILFIKSKIFLNGTKTTNYDKEIWISN